ncbi:MAG: decarboxylating NADP(+)-dependent phosphogluconate dehydrogenase [bacterium]|nr:decarboxylating NADP(+)-dependent phosphogluconate dehydrogenase [Candidatus Sumerlaeota bacterium]
MAQPSDIGVIGLAVMGENLILNMESKGFRVSCFNRHTARVGAFIGGRAKGKNIIGTHSVAEFCASLARPRKVMLMVKAGQPVDDLIEQILPHLEAGDIIIDGGNSNYQDTTRRWKYVEDMGLFYIGAGVSGGEEGALLGPSIMPGGSAAAWPHVKGIFQAAAAKTPSGGICCDWIGEGGAGHFVKMAHNGIEYGDMQMICEVCQIMRDALGLPLDEMSAVFGEWNKGELDSYLVEITRDILGFRDERGESVVDNILDAAGQKGTGKWMVTSALDLSVPLTLIAEAVFARALSAMKEERIMASKILGTGGAKSRFVGDKNAFIDDLRKALYASKIASYAQGYQLMRAAAKQYNWELNYGGIALIWRGGCIIRSRFLGKIKAAFDRNPQLPNLFLDPFFADAALKAQASWRRVVAGAVNAGIPVPVISSALAYFDGYRSDRLPANLLQAQRDYFGAHTYERVDRPRGEFFHTNWTGRGGTTASSSYNA